MPLSAVKKKWKIPPLALVCFLGLFLMAVVSSTLAFFSFYPARNSAETRQAGDSFYRGLQNYDALFIKARPSDDPALFTRALDRLEKSSMGVESRLSLLKRHRALARLDPRFLEAYRKKALEAVKAFPHLEILAAVAVDALSAGGGTELINREETMEQLRDLSSQISDPRLSHLALSARILSGDLRDPTRAATVPDLDKVFSAALSLPMKTVPVNVEAFYIDTAILNILKGDIPGAAARINALLPSPLSPASPNLAYFAGEFFYDYGNPLRAAELFALSPGENSLVRTADALWLGNLRDSARVIWTILAAPPEGRRAPSPASVRNRSLYNLAASTDDPGETRSRLEELFTAAEEGEQAWYDDPAAAEDVYIYGLIRYTRLLNASQALAMLGTGQLEKHPLLDLEHLRRYQEQLSLNQGMAETWMLLNRHNGDKRLYEWAAWYFDYQRQYNELALLIRTVERDARRGQSFGSWLELHRGLALMRESRLEEALERLRPLGSDPAAAALWQVPANLGRIMEARRSPTAALEYYKLAFSQMPERDRVAASQIQFRISRCLKTLGRERESRQTLEYALDLNPDNLNAKLDLGRLDSRQIF